MQSMNRQQAAGWVRSHAAELGAAAKDDPYSHPAWLLHFLDQVAEDSWRIHVPGDVNGFLLLYAEQRRPDHWKALNNYYASLWSPTIAVTHSMHDAAEHIAKDLRQHRPRIATLQLAPMSNEAVGTGALESALQANGWYTSRYFCFGNWYMDCEGLSFDDYMKQRESRLFNTWQRKAKKFSTDRAASHRIELITEPSDVAAAMDAYASIYAKSWKQAEPYPDFVSGWARICAEQGWLRLGLAWADGVPIAAQFWFTVDRRAYIFKLAYDEAHAKLSAGTVLSALLFRHSLDIDHVVAIDYLTGDDIYKRSWMSQRRERIGLLACNPTTAAGLLAAGKQLGGAVRQKLRSMRQRPVPVPATVASP
jgi:CelD/BcsL family acetyltransferase involved in cellulose biosynthesis